MKRILLLGMDDKESAAILATAGLMKTPIVATTIMENGKAITLGMNMSQDTKLSAENMKALQECKVEVKDENEVIFKFSDKTS